MENISAVVESVVRQILAERAAGATAPTASAPATRGALPKVAKVAMLVDSKKIEIQEVPLPELGEDDILVKVEGAGICGTDVHEWKSDPSASCLLSSVTRVPARWSTWVRTFPPTPQATPCV